MTMTCKVEEVLHAFQYTKNYGKSSWSTPIFFDGVLNSKASREILGGEDLHFADSPSAQLLHDLAKIVRSTKAQIVVSSTWRLRPETMERLRVYLEMVGLDILDVTPDLESSGRGDRVDEILLWKTEAVAQRRLKVAAWLAIDDMDLQRMNARITEQNLVRTDDAEGLTEAIATEAIRKRTDQYRGARRLPDT